MSTIAHSQSNTVIIMEHIIGLLFFALWKFGLVGFSTVLLGWYPNMNQITYFFCILVAGIGNVFIFTLLWEKVYVVIKFFIGDKKYTKKTKPTLKFKLMTGLSLGLFSSWVTIPIMRLYQIHNKEIILYNSMGVLIWSIIFTYLKEAQWMEIIREPILKTLKLIREPFYALYINIFIEKNIMLDKYALLSLGVMFLPTFILVIIMFIRSRKF